MKGLIEVINTILKSRVLNLINLTTRAVEGFSKIVKKELEGFKTKMVTFSVVFILLFTGALALFFGLGFYIEEKYQLTSGFSFIFIGGALILTALLYALFRNQKK